VGTHLQLPRSCVNVGLTRRDSALEFLDEYIPVGLVGARAVPG